ncbi:hypothetical protein [Mycolicibacterium sarraceniae]|uniref:Uncharacterized protein n=1 Tax=Mycolicibacterium sarraceniae TaxID=1534348 RepID=A0A7I7SPY5_9MYCO|nr:hypothetical protein [Mycolicibacterium sarraceniae]BBY59057.1 hypothetical protein MSAR_21930 [Mycolicibacterium sarraceniae]
MSSDIDILIPKSTAHQTVTCNDALIEIYRRERPAGGARVVSDLIELREVISESMRASRDRTARVGAVTLVRVSDRLKACAQEELGPDEMQAAMWRTAGRLHRWVAEGTAPPVATRRPSPARAPGPR